MGIENNGNLSKIPANIASNLRNDMYLALETIEFIQKDKAIISRFDSRANETLNAFKKINKEEIIPIKKEIKLTIWQKIKKVLMG